EGDHDGAGPPGRGAAAPVGTAEPLPGRRHLHRVDEGAGGEDFRHVVRDRVAAAQPALGRLLAEVPGAGALDLGEDEARLRVDARPRALAADDEQAAAPPDPLRAEVDDRVEDARPLEQSAPRLAPGL